MLKTYLVHDLMSDFSGTWTYIGATTRRPKLSSMQSRNKTALSSFFIKLLLVQQVNTQSSKIAQSTQVKLFALVCAQVN